MLGLGAVALTAACVAHRTPDTVDAARLSIDIPPPAHPRALSTAAPSEALLAKAPAPSLQDALIVTPQTPFVQNAAIPDAQRALDCLTQAVYYEARSEPIDGQRAVAQVVLNRVRNPAYPNSVCGTVYEGSRRATGCQFSFTCDGSLGASPRARRLGARRRGGQRRFGGIGLRTRGHRDLLPYQRHQSLVGR